MFDYSDFDDIEEPIEEALARLRKAPLVSFAYLKELRTMQGWQPLSLEEYRVKVRGTQREKVIRELEKSRKIINDRVKRENRLKPTKKD